MPLILLALPSIVLAVAWIMRLTKGPRQLCHSIEKFCFLDCLCSITGKAKVLFKDMEL